MTTLNSEADTLPLRLDLCPPTSTTPASLHTPFRMQLSLYGKLNSQPGKLIQILPDPLAKDCGTYLRLVFAEDADTSKIF